MSGGTSAVSVNFHIILNSQVGGTSAVGGFHLQQTASFLNGLPPDFYGQHLFSCAPISKYRKAYDVDWHLDLLPALIICNISGLEDWNEDAMLSQVSFKSCMTQKQKKENVPRVCVRYFALFHNFQFNLDQCKCVL